MGKQRELYYEPDGTTALSIAFLTAVTGPQGEDVIEQNWVISESVDADALGALLQAHDFRVNFRFEADTTTATVAPDGRGNPVIKIDSYR